ncbi:c-type cytochrome [Halomonas sp. PA16-9]|uniref:c-type cytochrome n=1 Tax=Halomonas sp. PA16-9 TaxID=2576841 RepID=UPI0030EBC65E
MTFANMLDDQQIADVAEYYSQMPVTPGQGGDEADEALLARVNSLPNAAIGTPTLFSCQSCHGPGGTGVGSTFPGVASQHAGYISAQLRAWKNETRINDPQNLMGAIAKRMSDNDIQAGLPGMPRNRFRRTGDSTMTICRRSLVITLTGCSLAFGTFYTATVIAQPEERPDAALNMLVHEPPPWKTLRIPNFIRN